MPDAPVDLSEHRRVYEDEHDLLGHCLADGQGWPCQAARTVEPTPGALPGQQGVVTAVGYSDLAPGDRVLCCAVVTSKSAANSVELEQVAGPVFRLEGPTAF